MKQRELSKEETKQEKITFTLQSHIVRDLKLMEGNTKKSIDELASTALLMFIATHNDFLGRYKR